MHPKVEQMVRDQQLPVSFAQGLFKTGNLEYQDHGSLSFESSVYTTMILKSCQKLKKTENRFGITHLSEGESLVNAARLKTRPKGNSRPPIPTPSFDNVATNCELTMNDRCIRTNTLVGRLLSKVEMFSLVMSVFALR